jgi:cobalt/nickel transport system permease protein
MHIPDGFLSINVWAGAWGVSALAVGFCVRKAREALKDRMVPLMGIVSAFIFSAQMVNFPVAGGTSGHLLGGVLAAVLLGPWAGAIVITCVLTVQALIFQDGGLTALGANILNMSIIGVMGGYILYRLILRMLGRKKGFVIACALSAWASVVLASGSCAVELALSGTSPLRVVLPAMIFVHSLIGIGEALITALVAGFVFKARPDLIYQA